MVRFTGHNGLRDVIPVEARPVYVGVDIFRVFPAHRCAHLSLDLSQFKRSYTASASIVGGFIPLSITDQSAAEGMNNLSMY